VNICPAESHHTHTWFHERHPSQHKPENRIALAHLKCRYCKQISHSPTKELLKGESITEVQNPKLLNISIFPKEELSIKKGEHKLKFRKAIAPFES